MRAGQVLDQGTPAELIARHAGQAVVRFTLPSSDDTAAGVLQQLGRLPHVQSVTRTDDLVTIRGDREAIAHVGAWLTARPDPVSADLGVHQPDLEAALLALLTGGTR